jgi:WhiB family redox-sensing transcriptional regulator
LRSFKEWYKDALCASHPIDLWFPSTGHDSAKAKKICNKCPSLESCRSHGLEHEEHGIWGGLTPVERNNIRKEHGLHIISVKR